MVQDAQGLKAMRHSISMRLEHWHYETFRTRSEDPALAEQKLFALFHTNAKGAVAEAFLIQPTGLYALKRKAPAP